MLFPPDVYIEYCWLLPSYCNYCTIVICNTYETCQSTSLPLSLSIILYSIYIHIYESKCCTSYWYSRSKYQYTSTINQRYIYTHSSIPPWYSYEQFPAHLQVVLWNPDTLEQHRKLQCAGAVTCVILSNDGGLTLNQKIRIHPWRLTAGTWEYGPPLEKENHLPSPIIFRFQPLNLRNEGHPRAMLIHILGIRRA